MSKPWYFDFAGLFKDFMKGFMAFFPIADYRPDVADLNGIFTDELVNVLPADGSYIPMPKKFAQ